MFIRCAALNCGKWGYCMKCDMTSFSPEPQPIDETRLSERRLGVSIRKCGTLQERGGAARPYWHVIRAQQSVAIISSDEGGFWKSLLSQKHGTVCVGCVPQCYLLESSTSVATTRDQVGTSSISVRLSDSGRSFTRRAWLLQWRYLFMSRPQYRAHYRA